MLQFIKKELLVHIRSEKYIIGIIMIPIIMVFILSGIFKNKFVSEITVYETEVLYNIDTKVDFGMSLMKFLQNVKMGSDIIITKGGDDKSSIEKIAMKEEDIYIKLMLEAPMEKLQPPEAKENNVNQNSTQGEKAQGEKTKNIVEAMRSNTINLEVYINNLRNLRGWMIEGLVEAFTMRYKGLESIAEFDVKEVEKIDLDAEKEYVVLKNVGSNMNLEAIDYYGVTMLVLVVLIGSTTAGKSIFDDRKRNNMKRIMESNLSPLKYYFIKALGNVAIVFLEMSIVYIFMKFVVKVNIGIEDGKIYLVLTTFLIAVVCFGMFTAVITKRKGTMYFIDILFIIILSIFGGILVPISTLTEYSVFMKVEKFTVVKGVVDGILSVVYSNNLIPAFSSIKVCSIIAGVFFVLTISVLSARWPKKRGDYSEKDIDTNEE